MQTREHNIIAFSLFGHDFKYCEQAVLNVQDQPHVYPNWVCRFYVDSSVPGHVINRLRAGGRQVMQVEGAATQWPGPMWRFLALDDPLAHRILFRDADAIISRHEALAVEQWLASDKRFHMMRDRSAHTKLILAGLWGAVAGSLPPLTQLVQRFMSVSLRSQYYADQDFLRQYVWSYARTSLMQHDSFFGFMNAVPFPSIENFNDPDSSDAGSVVSCKLKIDQPDGTDVTWALYQLEKGDDGQTGEKLICTYVNTVQKGVIEVHIPMRYMQRIEQGKMRMRLHGSKLA